MTETKSQGQIPLASTTSDGSILPYVQEAVERGWALFPAKPNPDKPGKLKPAVNWQRDELPSVDSWVNSSDAYAVHCGKSGLVVIDIDGEPGCESFDRLLDKYGLQEWPDTYTVQTPRGGYHLYFRNQGFRNSESDIAKNVDVRGDGGCVFAAGSVIDGKTYEVWSDSPVAELPQWLIYELAGYELQRQSENWYHKSLDGLVADVESAQPGERNSALNTAAFVAFSNERIDDDQARLRLREAALQTGLGEHETGRTLNSALRAAEAKRASRTGQERTESLRGVQRSTGTALAVRGTRDLWTPTQANFDFIKFSDLSDEPLSYRIPGVLPMESNVLFSAYRKAGKTSTIMGLVRALTSPADFLDLHCARVTGRVVYVNFELSDQMLRKYATDAALKLDSDKMRVWQLRGNARQFPITNDDFALTFAEKLKEADCEVLIIDPLSPIMASMGWDSNDNDRARQVCESFSMVGQKADVSNIIIVDHTGHEIKTRSRGASGKEDWADVLWNLEKTGDTRKLRIEGRGVDESSISFKRDLDSGELVTVIPKDVDNGDRQLLISVLSKRPDSTSKDVQEDTGWSKSTTNRRLSEAVNAGVVMPPSKSKGSTPTYRLTDSSGSE
jgi:Bifunctional DNA primase/polymerase, N-terminal/AAA domain/Winged helix-turn-helix DNA-binding